MRLLILGATGRTGSCLVEQALSRGHDVTAFSRRESPATDGGDRLRTMHGDVRDPAAVGNAIAGQDAVIWAIGTRPLRPAHGLCVDGTKNVIGAMKASGVRRLVCESAFGVGDTAAGSPYARLLRVIVPAEIRDKEQQEQVIRESGLDWVIVRPTILTNGPLTERYRVGTDVRVWLAPRISRADVAHFMLGQLDGSAYVGNTVSITY